MRLQDRPAMAADLGRGRAAGLAHPLHQLDRRRRTHRKPLRRRASGAPCFNCVRDPLAQILRHRCRHAGPLSAPAPDTGNQNIRFRASPNRYSCYLARETRRFATDIGLVPRTTPLESPQSNGMAEAFVRTLKRDYVRLSPVPDADTVLRQLPSWLAHYNEVHPHRALGYRSPREFIARLTPEGLSGN